MSDKSVRKKQYILDTARKVFAAKGFKNVTMKDIVEACDISRGGLYIYFDSTESVMRALLEAEHEDNDDVFSRSITRDCTAGDVLALLLKEQKKELLHNESDISVAIYEYMFSDSYDAANDAVLKPRFESYVDMMSKLIEKGVQSGELYSDDPEGAARNIMYVIEGLKLMKHTFGITEADVDNQLVYIMSGLIAGDD